jgi:hypothetical protein
VLFVPIGYTEPFVPFLHLRSLWCFLCLVIAQNPPTYCAFVLHPILPFVPIQHKDPLLPIVPID